MVGPKSSRDTTLPGACTMFRSAPQAEPSSLSMVHLSVAIEVSIMILARRPAACGRTVTTVS